MSAEAQARHAFQLTLHPVGTRCNLACRYCHFAACPSAGESGAPEGPRLDETRLETLVREHIAAQPAAAAEIRFAWQGGEPTLLGLGAFQKAVSWQKHYAAGRPVRNSLQTNATLLDEDWARFLAAAGFSVTVGLDGPRALHDAFRLDRGDAPTWEKTLAGLRLLRRHRVEFQTLTVVHRRNCRHPREVYEFLVDAGARRLDFVPLVERRPVPLVPVRASARPARDISRGGTVPAVEAEFAASAESLPPGRYGQFLRTVFDLWVRRDVGRVSVRPFDSALRAFGGGEPDACAHTARCGRNLSVGPDGAVYGCDHYTGPGHALGALADGPLAGLVDGPAFARFSAAKESLPTRCLACPVRFACHGGCPRQRFVDAGAGEPPVNYLCGDYGRFFRHITPAMREMVRLRRAGRPVADILRRPVNLPPAAFA